MALVLKLYEKTFEARDQGGVYDIDSAIVSYDVYARGVSVRTARVLLTAQGGGSLQPYPATYRAIRRRLQELGQARVVRDVIRGQGGIYAIVEG